MTADTSGSYGDLVSRANDLYDQGNTDFQNQKYDQGAAYFTAAAKVYAAAWKKQAGDPGVGTDYAVALFYSGDIPGALKQIDAVLDANPDFQKGWLNKGIFISHEGQLSKQNGDTKQADEVLRRGAPGAHQGRRPRLQVRGRQAGRLVPPVAAAVAALTYARALRSRPPGRDIRRRPRTL